MRDRTDPHGTTDPYAHLQALADACDCAVLACLGDGKVAAANGEAERLLGWTRHELIGRRLASELALLAEEPSHPGGTAAPTEERLPLKLRDGSRRIFSVRIASLPPRAPGDSATLWIGLRDPDTAGLKERLRDLNGQLGVFLDHATDVIFRLDARGRLTFANPAARTVLGHEPAQWIGRELELAQFLPPEEIDRLNLGGAVRLFREGFKNRLLRVRRKDGSTFWGLLTLAPTRYRNRRSLLGVLRDVSEFYQTREALVQQHLELQQTVAQLEEAGRLQEQFVANITHELRTPVTAILMACELLQRDARELSRDQEVRHLALIHRNATTLLGTINGLLDLAKLKRNAFLPRPRPFPLRAFLEGVTEEVEPLFVQKGLTLSRDFPFDLPEQISSDPELLHKVLANLLSNAFKFTQQGGAAFSARCSDRLLRVSVADSGPGIPRDQLGLIFQEFRQVDGSDSRVYPGSGLGLAIADRLTRLLGGSIEVTSVPGEGSVFTVVLPLEPPARRRRAQGSA
ncbi:MAG: ATP-binding protein [Acidobacteriota bacterium]